MGLLSPSRFAALPGRRTKASGRVRLVLPRSTKGTGLLVPNDIVGSCICNNRVLHQHPPREGKPFQKDVGNRLHNILARSLLTKQVARLLGVVTSCFGYGN